MSFEHGYETEVGERGLRLSGGEKQRVAIARVMLRAPELLLLDEATSALDSATEKEVQNALFDACKGRTAVVVSHRLSSIVNADRIIVLRNGSIAQEGSHEELVADAEGEHTELIADEEGEYTELIADEEGEYAGLWRAQDAGTSILLQV
ncbi:P-loop containing nucleoside triphosphate hydrolase protein [Baffinella frigidus]|nr:P-loop containing nucleoside triphosphate hydrolase protein [Cryptophyta sp. CCMP2293]